MKPRIASRNKKYIDFEDGSQVVIKGALNYKMFELSLKMQGIDMEQEGAAQQVAEYAIPFLQEIILDWNFVDEANQPVPYAPELIEELDMETIFSIFKRAGELYSPEKKSSPSSEPTS